jgi:hypothetical protein
MLNKTVLLVAILLSSGIIWSSDTEKTNSEHTAYPALFERFKRMEGQWRAHSTKGWEGTETFHVIARGSAILGTSQFKDEAGEGMATIVTVENGKVLLIHYCEAGNQPVLRAGPFDKKQNKVTFEFIGGTNIPSRDVGHMDKVVFSFADENHFSSQWTWYSKGHETWFENIQYERVQ